jgi:excisionase family DNA binding protein
VTSKVRHLTEYTSPKEDSAEELRTHLRALVDFLVTRVAPIDNKGLALREVLTADELAERLKVSKSTVEEMARSGKLPGAFRIGKHWRFDLDVLRKALPTLDKDA